MKIRSQFRSLTGGMAQLPGCFAGSHPHSTITVLRPLHMLFPLCRLPRPLHIARACLSTDPTLSLPFTSSVAVGKPSWPLWTSGSLFATKGPSCLYRELKIKAWRLAHLKSRCGCFVKGCYYVISGSLWPALNVICSEKLSKISVVRIELFLPHLLLKFWAFCKPLRFGLFVTVLNQLWLIHDRYVFCKLYNLVVFRIITWPYHHHHHLILKHFYHLKE